MPPDGTRPRVTVITPTYNHAAYIGACVRSVLGQRFTDWEQIVVDDGSTDATPQALAAFSDPRIRVLRQDNVGIHGLARTYNRALQAARGEFVAILEGDDWWEVDALERLVARMAPDVVLAYGIAGLADPAGRALGETIPSPAGRAALGPALENRPVGSALLAMADARHRTFTFPCAVLLRREALLRVGGFQQPPGIPFVDLPTFLELAALGPFAFVPHVVGHWRVHPASATRNRDDVAVHDLLAAHAATALRRHQAALGLAEADVARAVASWGQAREAVRYELGKTHAAAGRWRAARAAFAQVARRGGPRLAARAGVRWLLAAAHVRRRGGP